MRFGETVNLLLEQAQTMGSVVQTAHKVGRIVEYRLKQKEAYGLHPASFIISFQELIKKKREVSVVVLAALWSVWTLCLTTMGLLCGWF